VKKFRPEWLILLGLCRFSAIEIGPDKHYHRSDEGCQPDKRFSIPRKNETSRKPNCAKYKCKNLAGGYLVGMIALLLCFHSVSMRLI